LGRLKLLKLAHENPEEIDAKALVLDGMKDDCPYEELKTDEY